MKTRRLLGCIILVTSSSLALTACDPPMPPEVAAQIAEQSYTCIDGQIQISAEPLMTDVAVGWADSLSYACFDPEPIMGFSPVDNSITEVSGQISEYPSTCNPVQTVPVAVEAGVLVYMQSEIGALNLSPKSIAGILDGTITNWNELGADNPGYEMPNMPLTVNPEADTLALKSVLGYLSITETPIGSNLLASAVDRPSIDNYSFLEEGQVAVVPNSYAVYLGLYPASIVVGFDDELQEQILATPDLSGIQSATTQWKYSSTTNEVTVILDPKVEPTPPEGSDSAYPPYQAIYPVNYYLCSDDSKIARAVGRFILRLDSQGSLGASNYSPLSEPIRIASLIEISKGLPTPTPTPTE